MSMIDRSLDGMAYVSGQLTFFLKRRLREVGGLVLIGIAMMAALALGKPAGVLAACSAGVALKLARRPTGTSWREIAGVACLTGVGFTISYFVAGMGGAEPTSPDRAAILIGSIGAALAGGWLLGRAEPATAWESARAPV